MSEIHVRQIQNRLERIYSDRIDLSDLAGRAEKERADALLSRSLSAYALSCLSHREANSTAAHVTDGFNDNGVDGILFDREERTLYIVQSKWIHSGSGSPELGDVHKLLAGVSDLLNGDLARFNEKVRQHRAEIEAAIGDENARFVVGIAYTGSQPLSPEAKRILNERLRVWNDVSELVSLRVLTQRELHGTLSGAADGAPISIEAILTEWGQVKEPYNAVYGQVNAADVARWFSENGDRLFARNLRKVIPMSAVNAEITDTLKNVPADFWYFNNGITALCQSVKKKPIGGNDRASGVFVLDGVSVVNGAQTVGAIASASAFLPEQVAQAKVTVRFISLEGCPEDFAVQVTRATNTQNRIESRDFAALDPEQERLRADLRIDERIYCYKTGETPPSSENGCTIDEATVALACAKDLALAVMAKNALGKLWENIDRAPYKLLFNGALTGQRLWRSVEVLRAIDEGLRQQSSAIDPRSRMASIHGNRFIAHQIFGKLPVDRFDDPDFDLEACKTSARGLVPETLQKMLGALDERFPNAYFQSLFKSSSKCRTLADSLDVTARQGRLFT